jgi:hypothetical protein
VTEHLEPLICVPAAVRPAGTPASVATSIADARCTRYSRTRFATVKTTAGELRATPTPEPADLSAQAAVELVRLRLDDIVHRLVDVDAAFGEAHNHAARIARA